MSKENILRKSFNKNVRGMYGNKLSFDLAIGKDRNGYDWVYEAMEEYSQSQLSEYKEKLKAEIMEKQKGHPVGYHYYAAYSKVLTLIDKI